MTHKDIETKFMIEYDKANVTSSYPSLTKYEIATLLDKAYSTLITLKFIGNNIRKAPFESDIKSIFDLQPLIITKSVDFDDESETTFPENAKIVDLQDEDFLYIVGVYVYNTVENKIKSPYTYCNLVSHEIAKRFFQSDTNYPWIKHPVYYIENNIIYLLFDPEKNNYQKCDITFISKPNSFVEELDDGEFSDTEFELSDSVAEELINLAISYALENVESPRLNTHLGMRGLES